MLARIIYERGIAGTELGTLALAAGSIDEQMSEVLARKRGIVGAVTDGRSDESEAVLQDWQRREGGHLVRLAVSYLAPLGRFTTWRPALPVTQWQVTRA